MFAKIAATRSHLYLRQLRLQSFCTLSALAVISKGSYVVKSIKPSKTNFIQKNVAFCSTKLSAQVLSANYEEVKDLPNHPEKLLIDVREPAEIKEFGKIPTSINIPLGIVAQELSKSIRDDVFKTKYGREKPKKNTEIIFHCHLGKRSAMAADTALSLGYTNVKNYEGSWIDWAIHEGLPK